MLTQFQDTNQNFQLMQNDWATKLNPLLSNPLLNGLLVKDVDLTSGANVINHRLGRKLQGWIIVGINATSSIYDTQASNQMPYLTLNLNASAPCRVSLYVF